MLLFVKQAFEDSKTKEVYKQGSLISILEPERVNMALRLGLVAIAKEEEPEKEPAAEEVADKPKLKKVLKKKA